jgi:hypothetical protein
LWITQVQTQTLNMHAHLSLWIHVRKLYPYEPVTILFYSLRPLKSDVLWFKICPRQNDVMSFRHAISPQIRRQNTNWDAALCVACPRSLHVCMQRVLIRK